MIPLQSLVFEQYEGENRKYYQCNHLLDHFQLEQRKRSAILLVTHFVGGHHETIFHKRYEPTRQDQPHQSCFLKKFQVLKFQVAIPGKGHKHVGKDQKEDGIEAFHRGLSCRNIFVLDFTNHVDGWDPFA